MSREEMLVKIIEIFQDVLDNPELELKETDSQDTIEDWDSLAHINIISALSDEFDIDFEISDIPHTRSISGILDILQSK